MDKKYQDVKSFMDETYKHISFDEKLVKKLSDFKLRWSTKDDDYIEFLGSGLYGVHVIRFSSLDDNDLMTNVYQLPNWNEVQKDFYNVKGINKKFKVASNFIYHTLVYTAYRFHKGNLPTKIKEKGILDACLIMIFKMVGSLYHHYFKYPVSEDIANYVYNKLSHKYLIKQKGTWIELFTYRARECIDKGSTNYRKLDRYTTEDACNIITDIQTKIRSAFVELNKVLVEVVKNGEKINMEKDTFVGGEKMEKQVKDVELSYHKLINNITDIAYKTNTFTNDRLVRVTSELFNNINEDLLYKMVKCSTYHEAHDFKYIYKLLKYDKKKVKDPYIKLLQDIITIDIDYLQRIDEINNIETRLPIILVKIRNYWSSSKVKNDKMKAIKKYLYHLAIRCTGKKTSWLASALAIAFAVYVFLRSLKYEEG